MAIRLQLYYSCINNCVEVLLVLVLLNLVVLHSFGGSTEGKSNT
eukprot:SAG31_NODE_340_length_17466_cov_5.689987_14_plen_44_part_00